MTDRPDPLVALLKAEERAWLDATPPSGHPLIHGIFQRLPDRLRAALDSIEGASRADGCSSCGGPHRFDTSVPSPLWNAVIREANPALGEYLCTSCIVEAFVKAGRSFEAELYGLPVDRDGGTVPVIRVQVDGRPLDRTYGDLEHRLAAASPSREGAVLDVATIVRETLDIAHAHPLWTGSEVIAKVAARLASEEQRETPTACGECYWHPGTCAEHDAPQRETP